MYSYVCVLSTNSYLEGVLVLNENLKQLNSKYPLLCLINENISEKSKKILERFNIKYKIVNSVMPKSTIPETRWKYTFDKLSIFNLTEFEKIVYLDLDFLILENLDYLFEIEEFTMIYDLKENYSCSALIILKPNNNDYNEMIKLNEIMNMNDSIIGDQDIINEYFDDINELPIEYNFIKGIEKELVDVYDPIKNKIVKKYKCNDFYWSENPKIIHYYGDVKPFMLEDEFDDEYCYLYFYYLEKVRKILSINKKIMIQYF